MSDPVTNVEVEDVLTSIRRLVSASDTASSLGGDPTTATHKAKEQVKNMDKLVLTQALRIPEPIESESRAAGVDKAHTPSDEIKPALTAREKVADRSTLSEVEALAQRLSGLSDAAAKEAIIEELRIALFDRRPAAPTAKPEVPTVTITETPMIDVAAAAPAPVETAVAEPVAVVETPTARAKTLEQKIAELEAMIGQGNHDFESETGDPSPVEADPMPVSWDETPEVPAAPMVLNAEPEDGMDELASKTSAPHILFAHRMPEQAHRPAEPATEAPAPKVEAAAVPDTPKPVEAPLKTAEVKRDRFPPLRSVPGTGAQRIAEEELRDMIATILHEELRGELGERITRNVRKMVRREIQRALMSRELD